MTSPREQNGLTLTDNMENVLGAKRNAWAGVGHLMVTICKSKFVDKTVVGLYHCF
jgi:hypothetical protein